MGVNLRREIIAGPRGWPLLGVLPRMRRDVLGAISEATRYGDIVKLNNPLFPLYVLNHPDCVAQVLQSDAAGFGRSPFYAKLMPILGNGLLTSDGEFWRRQRHLIQPAFLSARLPDYKPIVQRAVARLCERWNERARDCEVVDVAAEMNYLAVEIIGDILFGEAIGATPAIRRYIGVVQQTLGRRFWSILPSAMADVLPTPATIRYQTARRRLDSLIYRLIETHRKSPRPGSILSLLLEHCDPATGDRMDSRQLRDELMTLFLAGHETTAAGLTWLWLLLAQHQEAERRVQAEADGMDRSASITASSEPSFIRRAIQETLRLYPPVWSFSRRTVADAHLGGRLIPRGSAILICAYTLHRHPRFWTDPESFDPDRFLTERTAGRPRFAYVPFGGGLRVCIGSQLAMMEIFYAVAGIASRFELRLASNIPIIPEALVTLHPKGGLQMTMRLRR